MAPGLHLSTTAVSCVCPLSFTRGSHPSTSAACVPFNACSTFAPSALRKGPAPRAVRCSNTSSSQLATPAESLNSQYDWRRHWFPVYFVKDLDKARPKAFTLLGEEIVLWRSPVGGWTAMRDVCPHRLIPLSDGRVASNGRLECAYHGWQFDESGACKSMPQGGDPSNPRACVKTYQCVEKQGLLWVKMQLKTSMTRTDDVPILPELEDPGWYGWGEMFRDLPYSAETLLENVLDAGHVPFTHHKTVSNRATSGTYDLALTEEVSEAGFKGLWQTGPRRGSLGPQQTIFHAPSMMRHTILGEQQSVITAVYATPTGPGRCRAIVRQPIKLKAKFLLNLIGLVPDWVSHVGNMGVLDDDVTFLHYVEKTAFERGLGENKPTGQVYFLPGRSDTYVIAFRKWLMDFGSGGPFGSMSEWFPMSGPRLPTSALLDHYHSHTENCAACRRALKQVKVAKWLTGLLAKFLGFSGALVAGFKLSLRVAAEKAPVPGSLPIPGGRSISLAWLALLAGALVLAALSYGLRQTENRFYQGSLPAPRNLSPGEFIGVDPPM